MKIALDFPLLLTLAVLISGLISLLDALFFARARQANHKPPSLFIEYARSFFPILLLVLLIRSFVVQPYRVPTGSLEPTVLPGDFILVNQFAYGLHLPVLNTKILNIGAPKTGDIVLFHWPKDTRILYVKRLIGTPGDHIVYKNKILTINGITAKQSDLGMDLDQEYSVATPIKVMEETLPISPTPVNASTDKFSNASNNTAIISIKHKIFIRPGTNINENFDVIVPPKHYFMMGDNRDNSGDSRIWGFVPEEYLVGKALLVWMSWDNNNIAVRWQRIGKTVS